MMNSRELPTERRAGERGAVSLLFALGGVTLLGIGACAIDVGFMFWHKAQLQNAADAAVLAAVRKLPDRSTAKSIADELAAYNYPNAGNVLSDADFEFGAWDAQSGTFTVLGAGDNTAANAIRLRARRAVQNDKPLNLFLSKVLGKDYAELSACALGKAVADANPGGDACPGAAVVGLNNVWIPGTSLIDSYSSSAGSYSSQQPGTEGDVLSNGYITLNGDAEIMGDAHPGPGRSVISIGTPYISGSTDPMSAPLDRPAIDGAVASVDNDNWQLPGYAFNAGTGEFRLAGDHTLEIPPGVYFLNGFHQVGTSTITISGPTSIYVDGPVDMGGNGVMNYEGDPSLLTIYQVSTEEVRVRGTASYFGRIIAPYSYVEVDGTPDYHGCVLGRLVNVRGTSGIHYDIDMENLEPGEQVPATVDSELVGYPGC